MKLRLGFISNSSSSSFIVKTRPTKWDIILTKTSAEEIPMEEKTIELLKKFGFKSTENHDPFREEMVCIAEEKLETGDGSLLSLYMVCNQDIALQFLVANDIPFKASVHYGQYLYSYDKGDDYIYVIRNFGIAYINKPKELEANFDEICMYEKPIKKIDKKQYIRGYDEKESMFFMTGER